MCERKKSKTKEKTLLNQELQDCMNKALTPNISNVTFEGKFQSI